MKSILLKKCTLACCVFLAAFAGRSAQALPITITEGNTPQVDENVLFNDGEQTGTLITGHFNSDPLIFVDFTSSSNSGMLLASGGQANVNGFDDNNPFANLSFALQSGATFTSAILNPTPTDVDGQIDFTVNYIDDAGTPFTQEFELKNGSNFFTIVASEGARITRVTFDGQDTDFTSAQQVRIGGIEPARRVPDGGTTLLLLGASLTAIESIRRKFLKRSVVA